jgi:serine/threonine protein kinase
MVKLEQGDIVEEYRLVCQIGSGASTQIWEVEQQSSGDSYALKIILTDLDLDSEELENQLDTFAEFADVDHENLLSTIHYGVYDSAPFAVVPLCEGDLEKEIRSRSLAIIESSRFLMDGSVVFNEKELVAIMTAAASGLDFLHTQMKKAHLDVKPANILYRKQGADRQYLLGDFDVAVSLKEDIIRKTVKRVSNSTTTHIGGFTIGYMAPEQCDPSYEADIRSDIFALGVSLYEMAMGKLPAQPSLGQSYFHFGENLQVRPLPAQHFSAEFQQLVFDCLQPDAHLRPTASHIKSYGQYYLNTDKWPSSTPTPSGNYFVDPGPKNDDKQYWKPVSIGVAILFSAFLALWFFAVPGYQRALLTQVDQVMGQPGKEKIKEALTLLDQAEVKALPPKYDSLKRELVMIRTNLLSQVDNLGKLSENTLSYQVANTRKWGFYRLGCGIIKKPVFNDVGDFTFGYAAFILGDTAGFLNLEGKIPFQEKGNHPEVIDRTNGRVQKNAPGQPKEYKTISLPAVTGVSDCH